MSKATMIDPQPEEDNVDTIEKNEVEAQKEQLTTRSLCHYIAPAIEWRMDVELDVQWLQRPENEIDQVCHQIRSFFGKSSQ